MSNINLVIKALLSSANKGDIKINDLIDELSKHNKKYFDTLASTAMDNYKKNHLNDNIPKVRKFISKSRLNIVEAIIPFEDITIDTSDKGEVTASACYDIIVIEESCIGYNTYVLNKIDFFKNYDLVKGDIKWLKSTGRNQ